MSTEEATTRTDPDRVPRDLLADLDAVLGDRPVSARYAAGQLARHSLDPTSR